VAEEVITTLDEVRKRFPAKFSPEILDELTLELRARLFAGTILDPYGGIGGIHALPWETTAVEIEPEFAACHEGTICADSRHLDIALGERYGTFGAVVTSPDYGNRFADQYLGSDDEKCRACAGTGLTEPTGERPQSDCEKCAGTGKAKSKRASYAVALGRKCSPGSGARFQFGKQYRDLHLAVLNAAIGAVIPGGLLLYNVSSSIHQNSYRPVMEWWLTEIAQRAEILALRSVETSRLKFGANGDARVPAEHIIVARRDPF
jgi:hypothetical protein